MREYDVIEYEMCARSTGIFRDDCKAIVRGMYILSPRDERGVLITKTVYDEDFPEDVGKVNVFCNKGANAISHFNTLLIGGHRFSYFERFDVPSDELEDVLEVFDMDVVTKVKRCLR